ncbi:MAG: class I SAM-dependent methyltransferase [Myxococcota bacterium]
MAFFGELYLRSTLPFLSPEVTAREVAYLASVFDRLEGDGPIADVGCGHGRHAGRLGSVLRRRRSVLGFDSDALSLAERERDFSAVRADFFRLPLAARSLAGAYAWYSTLFVFEDSAQLPLFRELARCVRPGGMLIFQTVPYDRVAREPIASYDGELPGGVHLIERSTFDPRSGRDNGYRELSLPDGRVLSGHFFIRYYPLSQHSRLLEEAGFRVQWVHGGVDGAPLTTSSADLIIGAERVNG